MLQAIQPCSTKPLWLYERDGEEFGPTDLGGLQVMAACQHLRPECTVWQQGRQERMRAAAIHELQFAPTGPSEPSATPLDARYLRLYRSADDRIVLGLCGGLAHRWGVPAVMVRTGAVASLAVMVGWAYVFSVFLPALPTTDRPGVRRRTDN